MRVNRRFLNWGVFLVAVGGVLVAADLGAVDSGTIAEALRFWPLAIVAIGLGLILRRTRLSVAGGMLAAAVPGLIIGSGFALLPRLGFDCGANRNASQVVTQQGTFAGPASVSVTSGCGLLVVNTAAGSGWQLQAGNTEGRAPIVQSGPQSLQIDSARNERWHFFDGGRDVWTLTLPTSRIDDLSMVVNAGTGRFALPGAQIGRLDLTANAAETIVDASQASIEQLASTVNAGLVSLHLAAATDITGSVEVNAGELQVCTPSGLGLRIEHNGVLSGVKVNGQSVSGTNWQSPDYASAPHHADLSVTVNLGAVEINPIGGCK
jgi:hypothetical protein